MNSLSKYLNFDQFQSVVRSLLKWGGGYLISRGVLSSSTANELVGIGLTLAGLAWSHWFHSEDKPAAPSDSDKGLSSGPTMGLVLIGLCSALLFGCQTPPQRQAYNSAAVPVMTEEHLMQAWGDYVRQYHPPAAIELKVLASYRKVKAAELSEIDAAHAAALAMSSTNGIGPAITTGLQSPAVIQSLQELQGLIVSLGVQL